ncbi:C40 family peptidase [Alicyclobacillus ferrooxydans]|uniref:C40 family peptidase n=1 Tax=Alicyclobacillus ferrooxydans TaxID=471514 RepID=UPI0006D56DE3|nr:C40 family peptidase [Alicyclobacillus ferrooxydans]
MPFRTLKKATIVGLCSMMLCTMSGCQAQTQKTNNQAAAEVPLTRQKVSANLTRVVLTDYQRDENQVVIHTVPVDGQQDGEDILDASSMDGIVNFATSAYPDEKITHVLLINDKTHESHIVNVPDELVSPALSQEQDDALPAMAGIHLPPRGVRIDHTIRARAGLGASHQAKVDAVLAVARSKIGTKYIWGHNEDRGQYGFDCSNFTEYVYHHALGYHFTTSSRGQYRRVGDPVSFSNRSPGDLVIFEKGRHVGIYVGNNRFINCGGGLGKVGYLSLGPGSSLVE